MKLGELYLQAIAAGMDADPRGSQVAEKVLQKAQKAYDKLEEEEKPFFDCERLRNPYADTRILYGEEETEVKKMLCGIDMETSELLLADALNRRGAGIDLVFAHHPEGMALARLGDVMHLQPDYLRTVGVLPNVAEELFVGRIHEVDCSVHSGNHSRSVDAARLLGLPMMCVHTPGDNLVTRYLNEEIAAQQPETVGDLVRLLRQIPEYHEAARRGAPPLIAHGSEERSAGKIYVDFTGGTSGPKEVIENLAQAGISTYVAMHIPKSMLDEAKKYHMNVVIAAHIASDSIGLNLLLDRYEAQGVEIVPASGLIRVSRNHE